MKVTLLYTEKDQFSYFKDIEINCTRVEELGSYSKPYEVSSMMFRTFKKGAFFDWHNAPQSQFIVYLQGCVEVEASGAGKRIFSAGDILFANDLTGRGHITKTLTDGESLIIPGILNVLGY